MPKNKNTSDETPTNAKFEPEVELAVEAKAAAEGVGNATDAEDKNADYKLVIADLNDKVLRAAAEVENTKNRANRDIQKARLFGIESFAKDLLSVADSLDRALGSITDDAIDKNESLKAIKEGIEITQKNLMKALERNGVKRIEPKGDKFNPDLHQAISQIENKDIESGTIIDVMQIGYTISDRLLRAAMVVVAK